MLFSFLAVHISEFGNKYKFLISPNLNTQMFYDHVEINNAFSDVVHEAYHVLQYFGYNISDYEVNSKENFYKHLKETYININTLLNKKFEASGVEIVSELQQSIKDIFPEIDMISPCTVLYDNSLVERLSDDIIPYVIEGNGLSEISIFGNVTTSDEFINATNQFCNSLTTKYDFKSVEVLYILSEVAYFMEDKEGFNSEQRQNGYSDEVMPVVFQFLADDVMVYLFRPMLDYFEESVMPKIFSRLQEHVENCPYLTDEQCINIEFDDFIIGDNVTPIQCITDL